MAATLPQYQKATSYDLPPDSVLLGSIIETPQFPDAILNKGQIVPIPEPTPVIHANWKDTVEHVKKGKIGIWARLVQIIGVVGEIGASGNNDDSYGYSFEKLETRSFFPDQTYLNEALQKSRIKLYLEVSEHAPIYMVTGVKVVRGANSTVKTAMAKNREAHANLGVSATVFGAAVSIGPEAKGSTSQKQTVSFGGPSDVGDLTDFVIGYRLRLIEFTEKEGAWVASSKPFLQGAMMGDDVEEEKRSPETAKVLSVGEDIVALEKEWDNSD
jgi:hypothetical protein